MSETRQVFETRQVLPGYAVGTRVALLFPPGFGVQLLAISANEYNSFANRDSAMQAGIRPMPNSTIIDENVFAELKESVGADFIGELIDTFLNDAPQLLAGMHQALGASDADGFRRAAHSFKSNSATFGALALSALAKELEMMGKAGALDGAAGKLTQLEAEYKKAEADLKKVKSLGA